MENSSKSLSNNRFVIEDSIPKVTTDGEPHEVMIIVATISGLIAAVVVLFILFSLIGNRRQPNETGESDSNNSDKDPKHESTIIPIFDEKCDKSEKSRPQLLSVSTISELAQFGEGHLNRGFSGCPSGSQNGLNVVTHSGISTVRC